MKKYKRLFAFGCSFTNYAWPMWPEILGYGLNIPVYNFGRSGAGNQYIFNILMQINALYNFTNDDLIIICWTNICRDDRYFNNEWVTPGNIFSNKFYDNSYIEKYVDPVGYYVRDYATIYAVDNFLKLKDIDYKFFSMLDVIKQADQFKTLNFAKNNFLTNLEKIYKKSLDIIHPSFYEVLWNNNLENKKLKEKEIHPNFTDLHPDPLESYEYLIKSLNINFDSEKIAYITELNDELHTIIKSYYKKNIKNHIYSQEIFKDLKNNFTKNLYKNKKDLKLLIELNNFILGKVF